MKELKSLVNYGRSWPAIDTSYFPNTDNSYVWSGSPFASNSDGAWAVAFYTGDSYANDALSNGSAVRLVRGGQ
ncbi:Lcl C-terminal domain-containing protein [Candidatus Electrothrix sp.]|uniref:Lcl C-terminal domain-containing protein n=1 Tax=Candidatus Electrothrix sp. TaxID=2170559 RepID=UPI004055E23B